MVLDALWMVVQRQADTVGLVVMLTFPGGLNSFGLQQQIEEVNTNP